MSELEALVVVKIRFSDTDAMGVVWHGNYLKLFENPLKHIKTIKVVISRTKTFGSKLFLCKSVNKMATSN